MKNKIINRLLLSLILCFLPFALNNVFAKDNECMSFIDNYSGIETDTGYTDTITVNVGDQIVIRELLQNINTKSNASSVNLTISTAISENSLTINSTVDSGLQDAIYCSATNNTNSYTINFSSEHMLLKPVAVSNQPVVYLYNLPNELNNGTKLLTPSDSSYCALSQNWSSIFDQSGSLNFTIAGADTYYDGTTATCAFGGVFGKSSTLFASKDYYNNFYLTLEAQCATGYAEDANGGCTTCATGYTQDASGACSLCSTIAGYNADCSCVEGYATDDTGACTACVEYNPVLIPTIENTTLKITPAINENANYCVDYYANPYIYLNGSPFTDRVADLACGTNTFKIYLCSQVSNYPISDTNCLSVNYPLDNYNNCECGDSILTTETDEACDDGNATSGDGCNDTCQIEEGYKCPTVGSPCLAGCGDGIKDNDEVCDDGNDISGDGCSSTCQLDKKSCENIINSSLSDNYTHAEAVNSGVSCLEWGDDTCAKWAVDPLPTKWTYVNDANANYCTFKCATGYAWNPDTSVCELSTTCGNGTLDEDEVCDDPDNPICGSDCQGGTSSYFCSNLFSERYSNINIQDFNFVTTSVDLTCTEVATENGILTCIDHEEAIFASDCTGRTNCCKVACTNSNATFTGSECIENNFGVYTSTISELPIDGATFIWSATKNGSDPSYWDTLAEDTQEEAFQSISRVGEDQLNAIRMSFKIKVGNAISITSDPDQALVRWKLSGIDKAGNKRSLYSTTECYDDGGSSICVKDFNNRISVKYATVELENPVGVNENNQKQSMIKFLTDVDGEGNGLIYPELEFAFSEAPNAAGGVTFPKIMYRLEFELLNPVSTYDINDVTIPDENMVITSEGYSQGVKQTIEVKVTPSKLAPVFDYAVFQE